MIEEDTCSWHVVRHFFRPLAFVNALYTFSPSCYFSLLEWRELIRGATQEDLLLLTLRALPSFRGNISGHFPLVDSHRTLVLFPRVQVMLFMCLQMR